jgi:hypothetical protein
MPDQHATPENFEHFKEAALVYYNSIKAVKCPYLNKMVNFNARGKEHLLFNGRRKARSQKEQQTRLRLLRHAPEIISNSKTLQGYSEQKVFELNRSNHRNEYILTEALFYEFIAIIDKKIRIRVIVKEVGAAPPYFWSVIPFWKRDHEHRKNIMRYGNPEED